MSGKTFDSWFTTWLSDKLSTTLNVVTVPNGIKMNLFETFEDNGFTKDTAYTLEISFESKKNVEDKMWQIEKLILNELYNENNIINTSVMVYPATTDRKLYTYTAVIRVNHYILDGGW